MLKKIKIIIQLLLSDDCMLITSKTKDDYFVVKIDSQVKRTRYFAFCDAVITHLQRSLRDEQD